MSVFRTVVSATVAILLMSASTTRAVPPDRPSRTAFSTCNYRAVAALHPDPKLRNPDGLATRLCPEGRLPHEYERAKEMMERNPEANAGYFFVNARTRYIDEALARAVTEGATQVVVLGAGYDSRAYRFHDANPKVVFFEVDLPATLRAKQEALERAFGSVPGHVRFAPIDFDRQTLDAVLAGVGYDKGAKTFFILEGVAMYVSLEGVGATLKFMSTHSAPGSLVVYDYILRGVVDGDSASLYGARPQASGAARVGEPFVSGWTPQEAAEFAARHGLELMEDVGPDALTKRYLLGSDGRPDGKMNEYQRIILARVR